VVNKVIDNGPNGLLTDGAGKYAGAGSILLREPVILITARFKN